MNIADGAGLLVPDPADGNVLADVVKVQLTDVPLAGVSVKPVAALLVSEQMTWFCGAVVIEATGLM